jgi:hypothetical protein
MMVWDIPREYIRSQKSALAKNVAAPSVRSSAGEPNESNAPRKTLITEETLKNAADETILTTRRSTSRRGH